MKKSRGSHMINSILKLTALSALVLFAAACSSGAAEPDGSVADESQASEGTTEGSDASRTQGRIGDGETPVLTQLMLGTLQLESTNLAVDAAQAAELVPLWKALRSLTTSDTAAQAEIEAVIEQIQGVMTADQIEAISALEISPDGIQTILQDLGIEFGPPEGFEGFDGEGFDPNQFRQQFGGGGPGGGGGRGGQGGFPGGGGDFDPEAFATQRAERGFEGFGGRAGAFLFEPLIELLEDRAGIDSA